MWFMNIAVWNDVAYGPFRDELATFSAVSSRITHHTDAVFVLQSEDRELLRMVTDAVMSSHGDFILVACPTLDMNVMRRMYEIADNWNRKFIILDYKFFDHNLRRLRTWRFVRHVDIKTFYRDGPPVAHETFMNLATVLRIMGDKQFVYGKNRCSLVQNKDTSSLLTLRSGCATAVVYSGKYAGGNVDAMCVYGDDRGVEYLDELGNPHDTRSYFERYGACIREFVANLHLLDLVFHRGRTLMVMDKF